MLEGCRALALRWLDWATQGAHGVTEKDTPYLYVTERRHVNYARYSGCGDLAHVVLYACGIRDQSLINRAENGSYVVGWNVAKLTRIADKYTNQVLLPGDITIVWNRVDTTDAHVAVVRATPEGNSIATADYGQGSFEGGRLLRGKRCTRSWDGSHIGNRKLQRVISLPRALECAEVITRPQEPPKGSVKQSVYSPPLTVRLGSQGEAVAKLQAVLNVTPDGKFGPITQKALKAWQLAHALLADGICGPRTWAAINSMG